MIRVLFLVFMLTAVHSAGQCWIKDQPFKADVAFARCIGRWYAVERMTTLAGEWHGTIYDMYDVKGVLFLNVTDLEFNRKCKETRTRRISLNPDIPEEASLHDGSELIGTMYTPGGSFNTFWVAYFCPSAYMKNGVCSRSQVDIISRTMTMKGAELDAATSLRESLCMPSVNYVYKSAPYNNCLEDQVPNADVCHMKFIPYFNTHDTMGVLGRWYLRVMYLPDGHSPDRNLLGMTSDIERVNGARYMTNYVAQGHECQERAPATMDIWEAPGKAILNKKHDSVTHGIIFDTDYTNYIIVWYCNGLPKDVCENPRVSLWSRGPVVSPSIKAWTKTALKYLCNLSNEFQFPNAATVNCPRVTAKGSGSAALIAAPVTTHLITSVVYATYWTFH